MLLLGIDVKEARDDVQRFVHGRGITYPVALDSGGMAAALYEAHSLPTTVVIGRDGLVLLHEPGAIGNAEVAFGILLEQQRELMKTVPPISPEEFRQAFLDAGHPSGISPVEAIEPELTGRALELAGRIRCPSCDDSLLECDGGKSRRLRRKLAELDVDDMTDAEVLETLFMIPETAP